MILVVDANILFSALLKKSVTAELLFKDEIMLCTPEFIMEEFLKCQKPPVIDRWHEALASYLLNRPVVFEHAQKYTIIHNNIGLRPSVID